MRVVTDLDARRNPAGSLRRGSAVTIGAYDGLHLGHRHLLGELKKRAVLPPGSAEAPLETVVVTFDRHPATVVRPESAPLLLCDEEQKIELLAAQGIDTTVVVAFDAARAHESAESFVDEVLVGALGARVVVVGENFHFGHNRAGTVASLAAMGASRGFTVVGLPLDGDPSEGAPVSSTRIRKLLAAGAVAEAAVLLERPHEVRGPVVHGDGRGGAVVGFPTANVAVAEGILLPERGIYAGWLVRDGGAVLPAALSIGVRPTFADGARPPVLEAYVLDFAGNLYGERVAVRFAERIRDEMAFASVEALADQIAADVRHVRTVLDLRRASSRC